ncbi:hypothetical protein [Nocardia sp. NPDC057227]|uniref:hypothetical protein n=1 Tax=Nocardia sp. NPDC057227 TaxID=3346056 RepID=UPI00362CF0C3
MTVRRLALPIVAAMAVAALVAVAILAWQLKRQRQLRRLLVDNRATGQGTVLDAAVKPATETEVEGRWLASRVYLP